jgi:hypothetical protein
LPAQLAQRAHLVAADWMRARLAVLRTTDVQRRRTAELDLAIPDPRSQKRVGRADKRRGSASHHDGHSGRCGRR